MSGDVSVKIPTVYGEILVNVGTIEAAVELIRGILRRDPAQLHLGLDNVSGASPARSDAGVTLTSDGFSAHVGVGLEEPCGGLLYGSNPTGIEPITIAISKPTSTCRAWRSRSLYSLGHDWSSTPSTSSVWKSSVFYPTQAPLPKPTSHYRPWTAQRADKLMRNLSVSARKVLRELMAVYPHTLSAKTLVAEAKLGGSQAVGPVIAAINRQADYLECDRPIRLVPTPDGSEQFTLLHEFVHAIAPPTERGGTLEFNRPSEEKVSP